MLQRTTPSIDYLDRDVFDAFAFSQIVRANDTVYFAGIAPLRGGLHSLELVGEGDVAAQLRYVLNTLDQCLLSAGLKREHLVSWTFYSTDISALARVLPAILVSWVGAHRPVSTTVEVRALMHPSQQIEITAMAFAPPPKPMGELP